MLCEPVAAAFCFLHAAPPPPLARAGRSPRHPLPPPSRPRARRGRPRARGGGGGGRGRTRGLPPGAAPVGGGNWGESRLRALRAPIVFFPRILIRKPTRLISGRMP